MANYLVNGESVDFEISIAVNVEPSKCLVISDSERREGFIEMHVKPIDANVQVATENE